MMFLTGGSGLLGQELQKLLTFYAPSHKEFDITKDIIPGEYNTIVHAAAYTDVAGPEDEASEMAQCYRVNVLGTRNLAKQSANRKFIYISTEYVVEPTNFYALTKLQGEKEVERYCWNYLVIRCLFKPKPFEHDRAVMDMWTTGDYVDVMAKEIALAIRLYEQGKIAGGILNIGTGLKSIYDLAKKTRPDVIPICRADIDVILPFNTSLNLDVWYQIKELLYEN